MTETIAEQEQEQPQEPTEAPQEPAEEPDHPITVPEQDEPEQAPDQPAAEMDDAQQIQATKDSAADWKRFRSRTIERWKPFEQFLLDCPLCLDQHKGLIDVRQAGLYPEQAVQVISQYLGVVRPVELKQLPDTRTCDVCGGEGEGLTGSNNPRYRTRPCPACKGFGYLPPPNTGQPLNGDAVPAFVQAAEMEGPVATGDADSWGHPRLLADGRENPNFGRMPAYVDPQYP